MKMEKLLGKDHELINAEDRAGATPILYAARGAQKKMIEYLLARQRC